MTPDARWMRAAIALGERGRGTTAPSPSVGCIVVKDGEVVGRGWTAPGGRPHGEAAALEEAGDQARGATAYVTLEPCAHESTRGPACSTLLIEAGLARVVIAVRDPDPRTDGSGIKRLGAAGIEVDVGIEAQAAAWSLGGYLTRQKLGRPRVSLKLAMSLDGRIALPSRESRWITGDAARRHVHRERARSDMILVGRGTLEADQPRLDVRLRGQEHRSPRRALLTSGTAPEGWAHLAAPEAIAELTDVNDLLVEGGAGAAAAFLKEDLVDRLLLYRAPIIIGDGFASIGDIGLRSLADAHGRWRLHSARMLGTDRFEAYERVRD